LVFEEMERNFIDIIKAANTDASGDEHIRGAEQGDILRGLLQANAMAQDGQRLSEREVLADIYVGNFIRPPQNSQILRAES
jgi:hypothetical protein